MQIRLESPTHQHQDRFLSAVHRSRELHRGRVTPPSTPTDYKEYLNRLRGVAHIGHFVMAPDDSIMGVINLNEIVRAAFQSAYVGYYAFTPHTGKGAMTEGLKLVIERAFRKYKLHRLEANIMPDNDASLQLVQRVGFQKEGYSPRYLKICGRWRDHERWALVKEDWLANLESAPSEDELTVHSESAASYP